MDMEKITGSSNVAAVGYDPETRELQVEFISSGTYLYKNVPPAIYNGLLNSASKGFYFAKNVKGRFDSEKL